MDTKTKAQLDQINLELRQLFDHLKLFTDDQLNRPGPKGKWSILQNMHHLILAEGYAQRYVAKKMSFNPTLKKAGILHSIRSKALTIFMAGPIKRKAPKAVGVEHLPTDAEYWGTIKQWREQREELATLLKSYSDDILSRELYKHPFAGRFNAYQMLCFYQSHFKRHQRAIKRITSGLVPQKDGIKAEIMR